MFMLARAMKHQLKSRKNDRSENVYKTMGCHHGLSTVPSDIALSSTISLYLVSPTIVHPMKLFFKKEKKKKKKRKKKKNTSYFTDFSALFTVLTAFPTFRHSVYFFNFQLLVSTNRCKVCTDILLLFTFVFRKH